MTRSPVLICAAEVVVKEVEWLWENRMPMGRITLMVGKEGQGKSFLSADMAARVSKGRPWPDGSECTPGSVIFVTAEDGIDDTLVPRLIAAGADLSRIHILRGIRKQNPGQKPVELLFTLADIAQLEAAIKEVGDCVLIVIDPIGSFLGGSIDAYRDNEVRSVLTPLAELGSKYGPAILMIAHRRKGNAGVADDTALGSRAFTAMARAVWHVTPDRGNPDRRYFLPGKCNLSKKGSGLAYTITGNPPRVEWEESPVSLTADDAIAEEAGSDSPGPEPKARAAAVEWLEALLEGGAVAVGDLKQAEPGTIRAEAEAAGIKWGTVRRASEEMGLIKERCQFSKKFQWRLRKEDQK